MKNSIKVNIQLTFGKNEGAEIETKDIPMSMILESLTNFNRFISRQLVDEAKKQLGEGLEESAYERYLEGRLKVDRETLQRLLNN